VKTVTDVRIDLSGLEIWTAKALEYLEKGDLVEAAAYGQKISQEASHIAASLQLLADKGREAQWAVLLNEIKSKVL